jgi:hypothetical protein
MTERQTVPTDEIRSYHGQPILKSPVWTWEIPVYFFTGGLSGASAGLAYLAELRGDERLAHRAWLVALAGVLVSPLLLISDLGRPARFFNMLRMFKVSSPMSVGSWILSVTGMATAVSAAHSLLGVCPRLAKLARPVAALTGLPLSTYTAALIADTAVPAWHEARATLPFLFGAGAGLSADAATMIATPPESAAPARRVAIVGGVAELATKQLVHKMLGEHAEPYRDGAAARFGHASDICIVAGLLWIRRIHLAGRCAQFWGPVAGRGTERPLERVHGGGQLGFGGALRRWSAAASSAREGRRAFVSVVTSCSVVLCGGTQNGHSPT